MTEIMRNAGDVVWDDLFIVNPVGTEINILGMCNEINIYEDIFSPAMYGNLIMVDTHNLLTTLPIVGQEYLFVKFHTPGAKETAVDRVFKINKVSNREVTGDKQTYILHFISYDAHLDLLWTYTGTVMNKPAGAIRSIIREMRERSISLDSFTGRQENTIPDIFKQQQASSNENTLNSKISAHNAKYANFVEKMGSLTQLDAYRTNDPLLGRYNDVNMSQVFLTSPQWGAFETIGYITDKAYMIDKQDTSESSGSYAMHNDTFLFYDTNKGYRFKAVGDLFTQKYKKFKSVGGEAIQTNDEVEYKDSFVFDHSQPAGNPAEQLPKIMDFRYINTLDMMSLVSNHGLGHTVYNHDLIFKTFSMKKFRAIDHTQMVLNDYSILGLHRTQAGKPLKTTTPTEAKRISQELSCVSQYPDNETMITYGNMRYGTIAASLRERNDIPGQYRLPLLNKLNMLRLDIDVWGRTWLIPGDIVHVTFGKYTQTTEVEKDDKTMSGKYIITAIHHRLSPLQHVMTMQVATDSTTKNLDRLIA